MTTVHVSACVVGGGPAGLMLGLLLPAPAILCAGIIWCAHIGFDRALGYGLKYSSGFGHTHLGRVGRPRANPPDEAAQSTPAKGIESC